MRRAISIPGRTWWWSAMRFRAAILKSSACSTSGFRSPRWPRCCRKSFSPGANRWWSRARTARRRRPACWRGSTRSRGLIEPSFLIGGVAENFGTSFQLRPTRTFILEGDEYDTAFFDKGPKFLHYFPDALILTHVEFDHADIYADLEAVKTAFKRLVNLVPRRGRDRGLRRQRQRNGVRGARVLPRGAIRIHRGSRTGASATCGMRTGVTRWEVWHDGALWAELEMQLAGEHNALNATAAAALAAGQGIGKDAIRQALGEFQEREAAAGSARGDRRRHDHR